MQNDQYKQFNCYQVLGVSQYATLDEIRNAHRQASLKCHPDRGGTNEAQLKINLARDILKDPIQRSNHDNFWLKSTTKSYARPKTTKEYNKSQTYTSPRETAQETKRAQNKRPHQKPLIGLKNRIHQQVEKEKARIRQDLNNRTQRNENSFTMQFSNRRKETIFIIFGIILLSAITVLGEYPLLWVGVIFLGWLLISRLTGIKIANQNFSIFDFKVMEKLKRYAKQIAEESCAKDIHNLERHFASFSYIVELLLHPSSLDDSEEQVTRRIITSFFLMGYRPIEYEREERTLVFTDGEEKILVRFRHRAGIATNISYVKKLVSLMKQQRSTRSFLFCSPGLSGNAANYANIHNIKCYELETMNQWIEQMLASNYNGPAGDILLNLDKLRSFLETLSPKIAIRRSRSHYRYGKYRY